MKADEIQSGLAAIKAANDPVEKHLLLAALCTRLFSERGVDLVVVGGSAIEFYTDGAYVSGDVDLCVSNDKRLSLRDRQELMGSLEGRGGPRNWEVAGAFVDILGPLEGESKTPHRIIQTSLGPVSVAAIEDLLVERVLVANYPSPYPPALDCARKLIAAGLTGEAKIDWKEAIRIAKLPTYGNEAELRQTIETQARALGYRSPFHSDR